MSYGGFRDERDNTSSTPVYRPPSYTEDYPAPAESTSTLGFSRRAVTPAELDDVFDDPSVGDPGMERMVVHALWELVLLVATAGLAAKFYHTHRAGLTGDGLRGVLLTAATLGFLTLAAGLSLRAGVVNLAVGPFGDPAVRRGTGAAVIALLATIGSCVLAAMAGILGLVANAGLPKDGFALTGLALGAALLGGTSAFGRRGGIFGSLFSASLL